LILLTFLQLTMLELGSSARFLRWLQWINLNSQSTGLCVGPLNLYQQTLLALLFPIILLAGMALMACMQRICLHFFVHKQSEQQQQQQQPSTGPSVAASTSSSSSASASTSASASSTSSVGVTRLVSYLSLWGSGFSMDRYVGRFFAVLLFGYTNVASTCLRYLNCVSVNFGHSIQGLDWSPLSGTKRVIFSMPSADCDSEEYRSYLAAVIIFLILYVVGLPIYLLYVLWTHKQDLWRGKLEMYSNSDAEYNTSSSLAASSEGNSDGPTRSRAHTSLHAFTHSQSPANGAGVDANMNNDTDVSRGRSLGGSMRLSAHSGSQRARTANRLVTAALTKSLAQQALEYRYGVISQIFIPSAW
jgi:hypothetical protein